MDCHGRESLGLRRRLASEAPAHRVEFRHWSVSSKTINFVHDVVQQGATDLLVASPHTIAPALALSVKLGSYANCLATHIPPQSSRSWGQGFGRVNLFRHVTLPGLCLRQFTGTAVCPLHLLVEQGSGPQRTRSSGP